jgi:hypothetical protein
MLDTPENNGRYLASSSVEQQTMSSPSCTSTEARLSPLAMLHISLLLPAIFATHPFPYPQLKLQKLLEGNGPLKYAQRTDKHEASIIASTKAAFIDSASISRKASILRWCCRLLKLRTGILDAGENGQ